ncbi:filamentous haemagglutinin family protein [Burkholderia anthina]|uniref:filamentous haemagglutinin family protein n=2 Tax=Burkholderia anthina TaxID=179879 RepID=UPI001FC7FA51|nr:filamentous haemagglutinin family protein [Burkholderia anthina]
MLAAVAPVHAHAAGIMNLGQVAARTPGGGAAGAGGLPGAANLGVSPQQALQASQPSIRNLGHAAQAVAAQIAAQQSAAAAAAALPSTVPNGLTPGGLQVAAGATNDPNKPVLWFNANAPTQNVDASGHVNVDVKQTGQNAVLTWQTMNVGRQTTLNFDQSAGTQTNGANNWAVLNRVNDPSGRPSQILGNVTAQGAVYVINRNGVLFGAGSQVNVHSLVASSLDLLNTNNHLVQTPDDVVASNKLFLSMPAGTTGGLAYPESGNSNVGGVQGVTGVPNEVLGLGNQASVSASNPYLIPGDVTIEPGASIATHTTGTVSDGGFVLVAAPNVTNGGSITATAGQVVLAAGVGVSLRPNPGNPQVLVPELSGQLVTGTGANQTDVTPASTLTNTGIIQAARGNVNLLGSRVAQNGVVGVTTSVSTPGAITISTVDEYSSNNPLGQSYTGGKPVSGGANGADDMHRAGLLSFGPNAVTMVLPDDNGQTATSSPGATFTPGSITMTAGSVWFQGGSLIEAPGSTVSVAALTPGRLVNGEPLFPSRPPGDTAVPGRIYVDSGATIDVSGLANVELPIAQTLLTVDRIGQNELADSPLLRNSFLFGLKGVVVDSTLSGTRSDGVQWVGSPILNLSGYVNLIPRTVDQLLTNGGTIILSGNEVMTATGSSLNLNGGYVHYDGGMVNTTRLVDANGAIVPIGQASPYDKYVGIAGEFTESHPRWGVTKTWYNPLLNTGVYEGDYIVGGNAGTLDLYATKALVLDGDITAQAFGGSKQVQGNSLPAGGMLELGIYASLSRGVSTSTSGESGLVILQDTAPQLAGLSPSFSINTPLDTTALGALSSTDPNNVLATTVVPVSTLNAGGFAKLKITEDKTDGKGFVVADGTQLKLQPGGSVSVSAPLGSLVAGSLIVPSGTISIAAGGDITVGPNALLSTAGQWVNNDAQTAAGTTPGNSAYLNGGSVALSAPGIDLQPGSVIDVSSGGEMLANGQLLMSNGIPMGKGGSVSLSYVNANGGGFPAELPTNPNLQLDGTIRSLGLAGGGTLTLQAPGFQIGGDPAAAPAWALALPADFFARQGFGKYVLNALFDASVAPGAVVNVTQQNLIPDVPALQHAASGADLLSGGLTTAGTLDPYHRQPTSLVMTGGGYLAWRANSSTGQIEPVPDYPGVTGGVSIGQGASIVADAGASIGLGSPAQVTVLGSIVAPGGAIALSADSSLGGPYEQAGQYAGTGAFASAGKSVWLGPAAVLDVSGTALVNPLAAPVRNGLTTLTPTTGKVLPGGTVAISDDSGYVVAQAGSLINVSGAAASFDQLQPGGRYASQSVWSDAGSITLAASSGLLFDGTLRAQPGAAQAQGGTLSIVPVTNAVPNAFEVGGATVALPGATALVIQQSGKLVPAGLAPGQDILAATGALSGSGGAIVSTATGVLQFAADRLAGSGIETLALGTNASTTPVPIAFAGDVNVTVPKAIEVYTNQVVALNGDQLGQLLHGVKDQAGDYSIPTVGSLLNDALTKPVTIGSTVTLDAPYVSVVGPTLINPTPLGTIASVSDATLNVNASFIDLVNQFQLNNFGQANFTSRGDIRLSSTNSVNSTLQPGELYTPGNLAFKAANLYPSSGNTFILDAVGPAPTTMTFESNGASNVPLSAGGTLLVDATHIVQGGTVRAPSGTLVFGVGDPSSTATKAQFNGLPLAATDSVTFANGSVTSVSSNGAIIPYGTTVDGVEWQFNPVSGAAQPDLTAPPSKFIGVNGSSVALAKGATIDLSGGGNLQAAEWVPGTGGTRDVLSQYSVSYANNATGAAVPVNAGAGNVYAIVPGAQSPVAAYDPVFAQTLQPATNGNGTTGTQTVSTGVGQASLTSAVGQAVYLSGVPGLTPGYYTLLPGKYATLPGAYRVTVSTVAGNVAPGASAVLPDGTVVTAGYFADALTGSRGATPTLFNVQSGPVWQQYSQYTMKDANSFFTTLAASKGNVTPPLPMDGGQLVLAATKALALGATLNTAAVTGGAPAEVDIASQDIQVTGSGAPALAGYLQIGADALDSLNAGSLLIGGTRTATTKGVTITPIANSVVVSNDGNTSLKGPEILLVTKTDASGTDPNAANGLRVDAGASIAADGDYPAAKDQPIAIAGDGALLRVSNGAMAPLTRTGATGTGLLTVGAGATLAGGQALTLDSSGNLKVDPSAVLSAKAITADGSAITFTNAGGAAAANLPGFVIDPAGLAQFANAQQVTLRSYGAIGFVGDVNATFGNSVDLSAGTFTSDGGHVTLNGPQIAFTNETGAPSGTVTPGSGTLTVNAKEIDFGTGTKALSGFGSASMTATGGIVGQGTGTFDFGALPVTLAAPVYLADTSSAATVKTTGALTLNGAPGTALTKTPVGGAFNFVGGTLADNGATIMAPAGNVSLEATSGNLTIGSGSTVSSAGVSKQFFDVTQYAPAGSITLTADHGTVDVQSGSTLDFSGATGGGAAGSLTLSAPQQVVSLNGTLKGGAAAGYAGGSFSLDTGGAANLDSLTTTLASSGVNSAISVHTKAGNLTLSPGNTLTAHQVSLVADGGTGRQVDATDGNVTILGTIDASGVAGGTIRLYGKSGVDVDGTLSAIATTDGGKTINPAQRGGTVDIGTSAAFDPSFSDPVSGTAYNGTYGYESISAARTTPDADGKYLSTGAITLGPKADIDVRGGTAGGLSGGTVNFRAPLLSNGGVPVSIDGGAQINGARATTLEAYAVWSTTDATTGAQHFDGIVDPAGWYDNGGHLVGGTFTSQDGKTTITYTPANGSTPASLSSDPGATASQIAADLATLLQNDYFAPASDASNSDHQTFYGYQGGDAAKAVPGTLMGFVEHGLDGVGNPFAGTRIENARIVPGIELDNPSPEINGGDISILTNWNLGAGQSPTQLAYRFNGQAPDITFRTENNVKVKASLTDGFFQIVNPTGSASVITVPAGSDFATTYAEFNSTLTFFGHPGGAPFSYYTSAHGYNYGITAPQDFPITAANADEVAQYQGQYSAYFQFLAHVDALQTAAFNAASTFFHSAPVPGQPTLSIAPPSAMAAASDATLYLRYLADYESVFNSLKNLQSKTGAIGYLPFLQPPPPVLAPVIATSTIPNGTVATDNSPSPVAVAANALPMLSASLTGGSSASFRIVAGADTSSANPLALQAPSLFSRAATTSTAGGGNVTLDGHFAYDNANNPNTPNALTLLVPTTIRTGTGSIDIAAGNDVVLQDNVAPGVIYTAGAPTSAPGAPGVGSSATVINGNASQGRPDTLVSPSVNPDSAGDISIYAQGDITGVENVIDQTGAISGWAGNNLSQFWRQWMAVGNPTGTVGLSRPVTQTIQTSINFGGFDQGVMSVGGNVSVTAGGNITDLAVSLPTTWYLTQANTDTPTVNTVGGGNLSVHAGGNILSGDYFVAKGTGTITAGGLIGTDGVDYTTYSAQNANLGLNPVVSLGQTGTLLGTQDGVLNVNARQGANIGGVFNPSYLAGGDAQGYSATSAVSVASTTGDIVLGGNVLVGKLTNGASGLLGDNSGTSAILPATVSLTAFTGGLSIESGGELYPSATGNLSLIADQSIAFSGLNGMVFSWRGTSYAPQPLFGMLDEDPSSMPSPLNPSASVPFATDSTIAAHAKTPLHANDTAPVRIYSLNGSIVSGTLESTGYYDNLVTVSVDKPALIQAGQDIVNLAFQGQNLRSSDVTRIVAGRDIFDTPVPPGGGGAVPALVLGGPGTFDVEAGRNIGPLTSQAQEYAALGSQYPGNVTTGIVAVGNANNPNLPHESANVNVLFGVGPGVDLSGFISTYIAPGSAVAGVPGATPALIAFMEQYDAGLGVDTGLQVDKQAAQQKVGTLTADDAWKQFQALPVYVQQLFAEKVLFGVLTQVGEDYNNPASAYYQKYARGYEALNTLFPASLGYTANHLDGGGNGANQPVSTGNLDIRSTTIQTQQGGNISILGPGGQALVGSTSAPPQIVDSNGKVVAGPGTMGILTLEKGDVNIFTDQSVLLAQSRIFTEQGGDMTIWSSNGDINAGKGAKSAADTPAPQYVCDANHYCTVDARGEVTGAGIATLSSAGVPAGTVNLIAPRGTVDAGDAGIRAGNLNVAALRVANADNIQVTGKATGIPVVQAVNTGALTAASSAASAASQMAQDLAKNNAAGGSQRRWTISVQVEGFGDANDGTTRKHKSAPVGYDNANAVSILGFGAGGQTQRAILSREEQQRLGKI